MLFQKNWVNKVLLFKTMWILFVTMESDIQVNTQNKNSTCYHITIVPIMPSGHLIFVKTIAIFYTFH